MINDFILFVGASVALFLVGANLSFLMHLQNVAYWFKFKLAAVSLLLLYVASSLLLGHPETYRAVFGIVAVLIDLGALVWMVRELERLRKSGRIGLLPLSKQRI